jgi:hypothetical protein
MVCLLLCILGLLSLLFVLGHTDDDGVETPLPLLTKPESLATATEKDASPALAGIDKVRVLSPNLYPASSTEPVVVVVVAESRQLLTSRPTRKPTRRPTRRPNRSPSSAPSFEPTSFTIPPTNLFPVLPTPPSKAPVPTFPIKPPSLPLPFTQSPIAKPTLPSGPLSRLIQFLKRILGLSNDPPSLAPVGAPTPAGRIVDLRLVQAVTGALVTSLSNTTVVYLNGMAPNYTVVAITTGGPIRSVQFSWNSSTLYRTEKIAPYTLCGGRSYDQCANLRAGAHTVTANVNGRAETAYRVSFSIVSGTKPPNPTPKPSRPPTRKPTRRPTRKPTSQPVATPTTTLPPRLSCPRDETCPGENLMQKFCATQCVEEANVKRKRRAGWRCGRCPL